MRFNKKFWATVFTLTGTVIGAGILGLPYVFAKSGFLIGIFWLLFLGSIILLCKLYFGEVVLRTNGIHQLPGYAEKYLGKWGKRLMVFEVIFGIYAALLAYLIGEGQSFSQLFFNTPSYEIYFAIGFWVIMTFLLTKGLDGLKNVEFWGVLALLLVFVWMFVWFAPDINVTNLSNINFSFAFLPFGVVLFALLGFSAIPEMKRELGLDLKLMKKAIIFGAVLSITIYILFSFIFISVLGSEVPQVATLGLGKIPILFGIFNLLTSYFILSFVLKDMFRYDFHLSKKTTFVLTSLLPLIIYFILYFFNLLSFVSIIGFAGVISGGLTGIMIVLMNRVAKKKGDRKPEYSIPINWLIILFITLVFILGVMTQMDFLMRGIEIIRGLI